VAASAAGLGPLRHVGTTGSTNTDLVVEARGGDIDPCVLVADHQHAGRGRLDRVWEDLPGGTLLVSLRIPATPEQAQPLVAAVGAGARAAADALLPVRVAMKWPNDLVVIDGPRPGKLAGVLAEFIDGGPGAVVVGLGCNIETVLTQPSSTSVVACGASLGRDALLAAILTAVGERLESPDQVLDELRRHSATLGSRVRVEFPGSAPLVGDAVDLRGDGRLVVVDDEGTRHVVGAGDIVTLRPSA
jgi:BirA family biotin operon repressor/biotin-[acetyl-CoA-carboxylase] ligase